MYYLLHNLSKYVREVHFSFIAILPSLFLNSHNICLKILNHFQNILVFLVEYYYYRDFTCAPESLNLSLPEEI